MQQALCLQHVPFEGPGVFQQALRQRQYDVRSCLLPSDGVPQTVPDFLLVMGGPMSVNDSAPWIQDEIKFIKRCIDAKIPVVGVCLGSQFIAKALGAQVAPGPQLEIGTVRIAMTVEDDTDPVFGALPPTLDVFQWHGEGFTLPPNALLLASSEQYPVQAFRFGERVYGLLFHLELELAGVESLCRECVHDVKRADTTAEALLDSASKVLPSSHQIADRLIAHLTKA